LPGENRHVEISHHYGRIVILKIRHDVEAVRHGHDVFKTVDGEEPFQRKEGKLFVINEKDRQGMWGNWHLDTSQEMVSPY
jgi:hypothetical protein